MARHRASRPLARPNPPHRLPAGQAQASTPAARWRGMRGTGPLPAGNCHDGRVSETPSQLTTRRARLWAAAESRGIPLRAILTAVGVVVLVYLAAKVLYHLRDVILLVVVAS